MATDYPELTKSRLRQLLRRLQGAVFSERTPLDVAALLVRGEPVPYVEAMRGKFRPMTPGSSWGPPWSTTWFHVTGRAPGARPGQQPVALIDLGYTGSTGFTCEALAWRDGRPWRGVDPNHRWLPLDGTDVDFYLEAAANPSASVGGPGRAASMLALRESPQPAFVLGAIETALLDEGARAAYLDFKVLLELALELGERDPRGAAALAALNRYANTGDRSELQPVLALRNGDGQHQVTAIGHAHIDTAWLWPLREAERKVARSWSTQLALMGQYPDHRFAASQPAQYAWLKERHHELYEQVRDRVTEGRWEPAGAMWVEPDCNLPSGESLVRQLLHGQRFWQQEFGRTSTIAWLPDGFGFPASLPQILAGAGATRFLSQKLSWNQLNKLPHNSFWWEGLDGTRVLAHFPPADTYNGVFEVSEVIGGSRRFRDHGRSRRSLYLFGWGDGGGGPEADHLELARRLRDLDGVPCVELGSAERFFDELEAEGPELADWNGELYFELHRGTYTTRAAVKQLNRQAGIALGAAELWSVIAGEYPRQRLETAWKTLLLNQFHDILPGSSIDWVYAEAERDLAAVRDEAVGLAAAATARLLGPGDTPTVFNSTGHARREVVELEDGGCALAEVPACGYSTLDLSATAADGVEASDRHLENAVLRVEWDGEGRLTSVLDKAARREVLAPGQAGNSLLLHPDDPALWDAWDLDPWYQESFEEVRDLRELRVRHSGGLRGAIEMTRTFGASSITQVLELDASSRVLRFRTTVDWHEEHKVLRVAFPLSVRSPQATYEIQFGHIERPTHRNTSWDVARFEVCAHRWADLGEAGYGVALLNDSKYGHSALGNVLGLTLLRSPVHPDPATDQGAHSFTYALLPHEGDFRQAGVGQAAEALNSPLRLAPTGLEAGASRSFFEVDTPRVAISAVKQAEDSEAVVVRLYEAWGGACRATLRTSLPVRGAAATDLLEREVMELAVRDGSVELVLRPFQVLTVKLEK